MRILFAGNKQRGVACLRALVEDGHEIAGVLVHPGDVAPASVAEAASVLRLPVFARRRVNDPDSLALLRALKPGLTVLAGYGQIVSEQFINLAPRGCINLHGGKLPQYRGSSPMNWALINGEAEFGISIIEVDRGVDTGDVLSERMFQIGTDDTIADLQRQADAAFPEMLCEVVQRIGNGTIERRKQGAAHAVYYPLRFPDDGLILWDQFTAVEIHNRIRALTDPYPGAFTYLEGRRLKLLASRLAAQNVHGIPGRIYRASERGLLVSARDRCLWVDKAVFDPGGENVLAVAKRYARLATVAGAAEALIKGSARRC
jgi:methionyl-tRNA formyltransferase